MSRSSIKSVLPTATGWRTPRNVTSAVMPRPATARKSDAVPAWSRFARAAATIAAASGCSESCSAQAVTANRSSGLRRHAPNGSTSVSDGLPTVIVPVLSSTTALTFAVVSSASAERISTPIRAALPVATVTDNGVASPNAQGHAISSTDTAATSAWVIRGSGPNANHSAHDQTAISTTMGTKNPEILSARRCTGAFELCADLTSPMICASTVSAPTFVARYRNEPVPLTVAPVTALPGCLITGMDSPVIIDSSTDDEPSTTTPSTGSFSPGRTMTTSPTRTSSTPISRSSPSRSTCAPRGLSPAKARMASPVPMRARASSNCPTSISVMTTPTDSKYGSRAFSGNMPGAKTTTHEYANANTVPRLTNAFISGERCAIAANPLRKIGKAAYPMMGSVSTSCIHAGIGYSINMAAPNTGTAQTADTTRRATRVLISLDCEVSPDREVRCRLITCSGSPVCVTSSDGTASSNCAASPDFPLWRDASPSCRNAPEFWISRDSPIWSDAPSFLCFVARPCVDGTIRSMPCSMFMPHAKG